MSRVRHIFWSATFTLAVHALPFAVGLTLGLAAFHNGAGVIGAFIIGVLAGGATLAIGQIAFATVRTPFLRVLISLIYAVPAAIAGYQASLGLAEIGVPSEGWREAFAIAGAVLVSATAFTRMTLFVPPPNGPRVVEAPASPSLADASRDG